MDLTTILLIIIAVGIVVAVYLLLKKKPEKKEEGSLLMLQQQINQIASVVDTKLSESNKNVQEQFRHSADIIRNVTEKLTKLDETNRQVVGFADQLKSLQDILKNPKQRGILGEYYLETVLKNVLPPSSYQMQYSFSNGEIVDAVVFVDRADGQAGKRIIPIDSKFSLENYNRIIEEKDSAKKEELERIFKQDLKNRIDETAKYIRPNEGTFDFALMFIPAEGVYYDLMVNEVGAVKANTRDLLEYAVWEKNVHIVSPNTFYAYLQTILQGLRAFKIEESAKEIKKNVETLGKHLCAFDSYMQKLGNNLGTTVGCYNNAYKELGKVDKDVVKITEGERSIEPLQIDKPSVD